SPVKINPGEIILLQEALAFLERFARQLLVQPIGVRTTPAHDSPPPASATPDVFYDVSTLLWMFAELYTQFFFATAEQEDVVARAVGRSTSSSAPSSQTSHAGAVSSSTPIHTILTTLCGYLLEYRPGDLGPLSNFFSHLKELNREQVLPSEFV
ncbi:unnamed protein product, partial [Amoebophrya sp. A120]